MLPRVIALVLGFLFVTNAVNASCFGKPLDSFGQSISDYPYYFDSADIVFTGKVIKIGENLKSGSSKKYTFQVYRLYKNNPEAQLLDFIDIFCGYSAESCYFKENQEYLVFAKIHNGIPIGMSSACDGATKELSKATEDIKSLDLILENKK